MKTIFILTLVLLFSSTWVACNKNNESTDIDDLGIPISKKDEMNRLKGAELEEYAGEYICKDNNPTYHHFLRFTFEDDSLSGEYMGCEMMNDSSVAYYKCPVYDLIITENGDISFNLRERMLFFEPIKFNQKQFSNKFEINKSEIKYKGLITSDGMELSCKNTTNSCWKETMPFVKEEIDVELSEPTTATSYKKIVEVGADASCTYCELQNGYGEKIKLPEEVEYYFECPVVLTISPDYSYLVFGDLAELKSYSFRTQEIKTVIKFDKGCEGISPVVWSPDQTKMLFVDVNQEGYENWTKLHVLDVSDGRISKRLAFDVKVNFVCGNYCSSFPNEDFWFKNNSTVIYKKHWASDEDAETEQMIKLDENNQ